ncbi:hypothetical protein HHK36_002584 [Tetracentron sinense]|uniref:Uncharacterized protein n=1 Tax=Tetracentron sinense TaxID=13715 RepID=A0A834ZWQ3_TETSI|nr:hypothetical protein HHK36_002584 [Tetracentron sinense]
MSEPKAPPPLYKQRSLTSDTYRDEAWLRRKGNSRTRRGRSKSLTDEDLDELKACFELGFGFDSPDIDQKLSLTLPALGLYHAVNKHYNDSLYNKSSPSTVSDFDASSPILCPHTIVDPGNIQQLKPAASQEQDRATMEGCRRRGIRTRSDTSKRTGDNSRDFSDHGKIESLGSPVAESIATEWTDEKHSLYLNSMEASFVDQLYHSMDLHGRSSQKENRPDPNSSGQFKVLRGGCWQKINFERAQCQFDIAGESRVLLENPWIQHFRSAGKCQNVASDLQENGALRNEAMHLREKKIFSSGLTRSSKQVSACYAHFFHQDSVDSNTGVCEIASELGNEINSLVEQRGAQILYEIECEVTGCAGPIAPGVCDADQASSTPGSTVVSDDEDSSEDVDDDTNNESASLIPGKDYVNPIANIGLQIVENICNKEVIPIVNSDGGESPIHFIYEEQEVSDQNFVDEEHEGEKLSSLHRAKRAKTAVADASIKDQVVPNGKSPITAVPTENYASPEKEERVHSGRQSEDIDSFVCPESEPKSRLFLNQELKEEDSNA